MATRTTTSSSGHRWRGEASWQSCPIIAWRPVTHSRPSSKTLPPLSDGHVIHADDYGGDPDRIYISGHSAGGHSALMLALDPQYLRAVGLAPSDIAGVVSLAGPTGLENLRGEGLKGVFPPAVPDGAFSPIALAPLHAATAPPILLMTGLDDDVVYASSVAKLADSIRAGGGTVAVKSYPDIGHIGLLLGFADAFEGDSGAADDMARFAGL